MKKQFAFLLALTLTCGLVSGCQSSASASQGQSVATGNSSASQTTTGGMGNKIISLGTGSVGGTDNVVIEAISSVVNQKAGLKTSTVTTSGGVEIIHLIENGDVQGGYTGTIDLVNALAGVYGVDPTRSMPEFLDRLIEAGFSGVINFPTVGKLSGAIRQELEQVGLRFEKETNY